MGGGETCIELDQHGGYLTRLVLNGVEVLYPLDRAFQIEGNTKTRGGMPILFPNAGPDTSGSLPQHGPARDMMFRVKNLRCGNQSTTVTLGLDYALLLEQDASMTEKYPHPFGAEMTYTVGAGIFMAELCVRNLGRSGEIPVAPGFHPYFLTDPDSLSDIRVLGVNGFDPNSLDWEKGGEFPIDESGEVRLFIPRGEGEVGLKMSIHGFRNVVAWTDGGGPYVCIEPWATGGDAIWDQQRCVSIKPGGLRSFAMKLELLGESHGKYPGNK